MTNTPTNPLLPKNKKKRKQTCHKCNHTKPLYEFYKDTRNSTGYSSWCKACQKKKSFTQDRSFRKTRLKPNNRNDELLKGITDEDVLSRKLKKKKFHNTNLEPIM